MEFEKDLDSDRYIPPLIEVIKKLQPRTGLEVGFCWGMSAYAFLEACDGHLFSIDLDDNKGKEVLFKERYGNRWDVVYGNSHDVLLDLEGPYDWIYLDGDHSYESTIVDLENALPLAKKHISCDDYERPFGVKKAVDEFCQKYSWKIKPIEGHINGAVLLERQ